MLGSQDAFSPTYKLVRPGKEPDPVTPRGLVERRIVKATSIIDIAFYVGFFVLVLVLSGSIAVSFLLTFVSFLYHLRWIIIHYRRDRNDKNAGNNQ